MVLLERSMKNEKCFQQKINNNKKKIDIAMKKKKIEFMLLSVFIIIPSPLIHI